MDIVSWSFRNSEFDQSKPLYIDASDPTRSLSANEVRSQVRKLTSGFQHHGLTRGDCVCVVSFNEIHYTSLFLGIIGAGGCFSGANPGYTAHELSHHIRITGAKYILTSTKTLDVTIAAADRCEIPHSNIFVLDFQAESISGGFQSWNSLLDHGESDWVEVEDPDVTPAAYVSTSGTSGLPKAAIIPHSYFVSQGEFQDKISSTRYKVSNLIAIPPFHVFTIPVQHALPLSRGTPTYIMSRFSGDEFMDTLERFKITHTLMVPPILTALSKCVQEAKLKSLRRIYVGGSCATDGMQQQLYAKLSPKARIEQVYGMTEVGWATTWHDREQENSGSVGRPLPGTLIRLVDRYGEVIGEDNVNGEVHIKAPHAMRGYLNNPTATAEAFSADGWVCTGDVGYVRDGKWYVIDRTKDLIKVRGWQVSPAEIEASLLEHNDVIDAAVIGVPAHDGSGEVPLAFVVRELGSELSEKIIKSFLAERLARYKGVDEVKFVEKIPRNPTGKILRRVLRDTRVVQAPSPGQIAASAYSNAIKDLEKTQQQRKMHSRKNSTEEIVERPAPSRLHSRTGSLTDASTISDAGPPTPPAIDEVVAMALSSKSSSTRGRKRKGDAISPSTVKRRSARIAVVRIRAAHE